jgi:hypothetical protein
MVKSPDKGNYRNECNQYQNQFTHETSQKGFQYDTYISFYPFIIKLSNTLRRILAPRFNAAL